MSPNFSYHRSPEDVFPKVMGFVLVICFFLGCLFLPMTYVDTNTARNAAETAGYTDVKVKDTHYFFVGFYGCSSGDAAAFDVRAKNPQGKDVSILVCSGWPFKGSTVRVP